MSILVFALAGLFVAGWVVWRIAREVAAGLMARETFQIGGAALLLAALAAEGAGLAAMGAALFGAFETLV